MALKFTLLDNETLAVEFPYDARRVADIRLLGRRKWDKKLRRWRVHLVHLPDLLRIFELNESDLDPDLLARWEADWKAAPIRIELGPVKGRVTGAAPWAALDAAASFRLPGHEFSPLFQKKQWDGRKHLFSASSGRFPVGLWPRLRAVLESHGAPFSVSAPAKKRRAAAAVEFAAPPTPLREYQCEALAAALECGRGVVQIATGGGKTLLAAHLIARLGRPAFFFVHTLDLLYQAARVFERELGVEIGILGDGQARLRSVTVATVQTAARALQIKPEPGEADGAAAEPDLDQATLAEVRNALKKAGAALFDECHHVPAGTFYHLALKMEGADKRFGFSATPWRDDGHDLMLEGALGPLICRIDCSTLIDKGHLIAPQIRMARPGGPAIAHRRLGYAEIYKRAIVENKPRNRAVAGQARDWAGAGLSVLVLVNHIAHGEALLRELPEARFVSSRLDSAARQACLADLERKLHPILIATTLADEGLDVPSLDCLILAGAGKSQTRAYQRIGRALRPSPGKNTARVLDFLDEAPYLREHGRARLDLYRAERRFEISVD